MKKILSLLLAAAAALGLSAALAAPAQASGWHRVKFVAWGAMSYTRVEVYGRDDIVMRRKLPYTHIEGNSEWGQYMATGTWANNRRVGCAIYVNGHLRARDVEPWGKASCYVSTF